ncbi:MAG: ROK family transcriptional regulator [Sphaerochaetaceae bacterium]
MPIKKTISQSILKKNNIALVLEEIKREKSLFKTTLSKRLQLSFATVSTICEILEADGFIKMEEYGASTGGRKPVIIKFNPNSRYVITINMSLNGALHLALVSLNHTVSHQVWLKDAYSASKEDLFSRIGEEIAKILSKQKVPLKRVLGIGVAVPGLYDETIGVIKHCTNPFLANLLIKRELQKIINLPIHIMNDANLAAFGQWSLLREELSDLIFLYFSQGIGLGIIQNGAIFLGSRGYAGELGGIRLSVFGDVCNLEEFLNLNGIACSYKNFLKSQELLTPQQIERLPQDEREALINLLEANLAQKRATEEHFIEKMGEQLGWVISILIDILNPSAVFIGGDLENLAPYLLPHVQSYVERYSFTVRDFPIPIKVASTVDLMVVGQEEFVFKSWLTSTYSLLT